MTSACAIRVRGVVQGVGFRPFVFRLAKENVLRGWVANDAEGVEILLEGDDRDVETFIRTLRSQPPPAAQIATIEITATSPVGLPDFTIRRSSGGEHPTARISPDLPVCDQCLAELADPKNPRFSYPYINCTGCGPRYSVILDLPYDRANLKPSYVIPVDPLNTPVLDVSLTGEGWDAVRLRQFAANDVVRALKAVPGVQQVVPFGGLQRQLRVQVFS